MADARVTQGFVQTLSRCRQRPSLTLLEIAWRWAFGIPALGLIYWLGRGIYLRVPLDGTGINQITFTDPMGAAVAVHAALERLLPAVMALWWLVPVLAVAWAVMSGLGRALVVRRMIFASGPARSGTVIALQLVRLVALAGSFAVWFLALRYASNTAITSPLMAGGEPNLVLYFAIVIVASLGLFVLWGVVSWVFFAAPLLAVMEGLGFTASLRAAVVRRRLRGPMVEINLVMGIVKIALVVLAMVFSATPLPFESIATPAFMAWWYVVVAVWYCVASDFFHVARLMQYVEMMGSA